MKLKYLLCLCPVALTGCVGYNHVLFMTKSNVGLDLDSKPPTAEITISRKEAVIEPSYEGGKAPPVMASFSANVGESAMTKFFMGVNQTFAGGDAAITMGTLFNSNTVGSANLADYDSAIGLQKIPKNNTKGGWRKFFFGAHEPGESRPFVFGTDTSLGAKVAWSGVSGQIPDTVRLGFNRKEAAWAPVFIQTNSAANHDINSNYLVRIPSFLATVETGTSGNGLNVGTEMLQYFATGASATHLARQPGVRAAMLRRADPQAVAEADEISRKAVEIQQNHTKMVAGILGFVTVGANVDGAKLSALTNGIPDVNPAWVTGFHNNPATNLKTDLDGLGNHRVPALYNNIK